MKSPLKSLALILGAVLLSLPALRAENPPAGGPGGGPPDGQREMRREKMGDRMAEELGLSADQKARWKEMGDQEKAEVQALGPRENMTDENRAKALAIHKSYMEKRDAILTPEQREKAKAMREKMGKRREGQGGPEHHGPPPPDAK